MPDAIKRFRDRAKEMRILAVGMNDPTARATMVSIATSYEQMADEFEKQGGSHGRPQFS
jgi:hypothetical protein